MMLSLHLPSLLLLMSPMSSLWEAQKSICHPNYCQADFWTQLLRDILHSHACVLPSLDLFLFFFFFFFCCWALLLSYQSLAFCLDVFFSLKCSFSLLPLSFLCLVTSGPLTTTQVTTTLAARPFTSSASPSTARPLAPTSRPIGSINKHPDLRPITATVPVTRRPPRPPQGPEPHVCESKLVRGVQWPTTQRGETVDRPCPKGSLGEDICMCLFLNLCAFFPPHETNNLFHVEMCSHSMSSMHVGVGACNISLCMCPSNQRVCALALVFFHCCLLLSLRWSHQQAQSQRTRRWKPVLHKWKAHLPQKRSRLKVTNNEMKG